MTNKRVVEESWSELQTRLHRMRIELQGMLSQLNGKKRPPRFWKHERHIREWLQKALHWIDRLRGRPAPTAGWDSAAYVMAVYELDEARMKVVDDFHRLMEAAGESYFVG